MAQRREFTCTYIQQRACLDHMSIENGCDLVTIPDQVRVVLRCSNVCSSLQIVRSLDDLRRIGGGVFLIAQKLCYVLAFCISFFGLQKIKILKRVLIRRRSPHFAASGTAC